MSVSVIIFDCDGVMFDSRQANVNFYNHILTHFGLHPLDGRDKTYVHMHTAMESVNYIFRNSPYRKQAQHYREHLDYTPFIKDMVMEPGLKEVLGSLKPHYGLAVATNRSNTIQRVLEENKLDRFFDIVVSSLDVRNPKPHPDPIYKILNFFEIGPEECIYIGDSEVDLQTCHAAGVTMIAYKNADLKTDFHIENLMDIENILQP